MHETVEKLIRKDAELNGREALQHFVLGIITGIMCGEDTAEEKLALIKTAIETRDALMINTIRGE